jgi:hypothetical protein
MGRILFLSTVAFLAYRYISRSNLRHQSLPPADKKEGIEILPPMPATASLASPSSSVTRGSATEPVSHARLISTSSRAAESDPVR